MVSALRMKLAAVMVCLGLLVACPSKDKKSASDQPAGDQPQVSKAIDAGAIRSPAAAPEMGALDCPADAKCAPCRSGKCEWDGNGRITSSVEWACDAPAETRTTFRYDDKGNLLERAEDDGMDGTIEIRETFTWDGRGNKLSVVQHRGDTVTATETWTYDADGNVLTFTRDIVESIQRTTYDNGREVLVEQDDDGDGRFNRAMRTVYDANGNKVRWTDDRGNDGTVDQDCGFVPPCPAPYTNCRLDCG